MKLVTCNNLGKILRDMNAKCDLSTGASVLLVTVILSWPLAVSLTSLVSHLGKSRFKSSGY